MESIRQIIEKRITELSLNLIFAEVVSVDDSKRTVEVKPLDGTANILDVNLQAVQNTKNGILISPKVGSYVAVDFLEKNRACVILCEEIDSISIQGNIKTTINIGKEKLSLKNDQTKLIDILDELIELLTNFKVTTPSGPSGSVMPDTLKAITELQANYQKLIQQ